MNIIKEDANIILDRPEKKYFCVPTNGIVNKYGMAIMGKGIAKIIYDRYPDTSTVLGNYILKVNVSRFNHVHFLGRFDSNMILSFQTKDHWRDNASIDLIKSSFEELIIAYNENIIKKEFPIYLPIPGCQNGRLDKDIVLESTKHLIDKIPNLILVYK